MTTDGEPTYAGYPFSQSYLTYNGKRIGTAAVQNFEFIPDPYDGELHAVQWRGMFGEHVTATITGYWDLPARDFFWEELFPELGWQEFEKALDRRLRGL